MRTPSPKADSYRNEVQTRIQDLLAGRRPRHPVLSQHSTRRLILEGVVEEVRIYRLNKERDTIRAREGAAKPKKMPKEHRGKSRSRSREKSGRGHEEGKGGRRARSRERGRGKRHEGYDDSESENSISGGTDRHDRNSEHMMSGGASGAHRANQRGARSDDSSLKSHSDDKEKHRSRSSSPKRGRSHRKERFDRNGKPLVRCKRGWRDASVGSPPKFKFEKGLTLGLATHVKNCLQWGKEHHEMKVRRGERRERGSLADRRKAFKERKKGEGKKDEGKDSKDKQRERKREHSEDRAHGSHRRGKGRHDSDNETKHKSHRRKATPPRKENSSHPRGRGSHQSSDDDSESDDNHRYQRRKGSSPQEEHSPHPKHRSGLGADATHKAQAESDAHSRGERLARHEEEEEARDSSPGSPVGRHPSRHENMRGGKSHTSGSSTRSNASTSHFEPPQPVYEETPSSQSVEERDRVEAQKAEKPRGRHDSTSPESTRPGYHADNSGDDDDTDHPHLAQGPKNKGTTSMRESQWWSERSGTPTDDGKHAAYDGDDEPYFSDHFAEKSKSRPVSSNQSTPHPPRENHPEPRGRSPAEGSRPKTASFDSPNETEGRTRDSSSENVDGDDFAAQIKRRAREMKKQKKGRES